MASVYKTFDFGYQFGIFSKYMTFQTPFYDYIWEVAHLLMHVHPQPSPSASVQWPRPGITAGRDCVNRLSRLQFKITLLTLCSNSPPDDRPTLGVQKTRPIYDTKNANRLVHTRVVWHGVAAPAEHIVEEVKIYCATKDQERVWALAVFDGPHLLHIC